MTWLSTLCGAAILAGAGVMLACVLRTGRVLGSLALLPEPHRNWLSSRVRFHRALMVFFLMGYLGMAYVCLSGHGISSQPLVAAVFFFGALFVHIGISLQNRMSSAMFRMLQELLRKTNGLSKANQELAATKLRLQAEVADKNAFFHCLSHDLGELSRNILLGVGSIQRRFGDELADDARHRLERVRANAQKSLGLLATLRRISDTLSTRSAFKPVDLGEVVKAIGQAFASELAGRSIQFVAAKNWPTIICEGDRIREVLRVLVDNAVRYMGQREGARIELGWSEERARYVFWVRDNGVGIAADEIDHVFHVFRRSRRAPYREEREGAGLAFVKAIAETYDGETWVESELGKGSTFYFSLAKEHARRPAAEPVRRTEAKARR